MAATGKDIQQEDQHRISKVLWAFYCLFLAASLVVIGKIIYIQYFWSPDESSVKEFRSKKVKVTIEPERGSILDHNGKLLAISTPSYNVYIDSHILKKELAAGTVKIGKDTINEEKWREMAWEACKRLPEVLGGDRTAESYYDTIIVNRESDKKPGRKRLLIARNIDYQTLKKLEKLPLLKEGKYRSGMMVDTNATRKYPYGSLAGKVIGRVWINKEDPDSSVYTGIEGHFDYILRGRPGKQWTKEMDSGSILDPDSTVVDVEHGLDIRTTLDIDIQDIADRAVRNVLADDETLTGGCAIVMDVETGAIRAMVNLRRNREGKLTESFNLAVGQAGEPGSIFKTATLMSLLEDGKVTLDTQVATNKGILEGFPDLKPDKSLINYENATKKKTITLREGFKMSSNNVFRRLVLDHYKECPEEFINNLHSYKLNDSYKFDLEVNGYSRPSLPDPEGKYWSIASLYSSAIGYSVLETPLNMANFYNAIANKGKMMKPYLIEAHERDGETVKVVEPEILNGAICSAATVDTLTSVLRLVTAEGTGKKLKDAKCAVAGKTGTARVRLSKEEKPTKDDKYLSVDGFRKYQATFVGFFPADAPKYTTIVTVYTGLTKSNEYGGGNHPARAFREIVDKVWALDSSWGRALKSRAAVPEMKAKYIGTRKGGAPVPDVTGMGLQDAMYAIENNGYKCIYTGTGHVESQKPEPGTAYSKGQIIELVLR